MLLPKKLGFFQIRLSHKHGSMPVKTIQTFPLPNRVFIKTPVLPKKPELKEKRKLSFSLSATIGPPGLQVW
jgi:hypothetical protein